MDKMTARPQISKQTKLSLIRRVMISRGTLTRAQIVQETKISSTTVRSLLEELQGNGEIEITGLDESSGGRKAQRYQLTMDRYFGAAFCIAEDVIHYLIVNVAGAVVENGCLDIKDDDISTPVIAFLDRITAEKEIKSIGLGVPGVVCKDGYMKINQNQELCKVELGGNLAERYGVPVVMENDLNAITIGFGHCYETKFPCEGSENTNMAFIYLRKSCVSAGVLVGGKIVRGCNNFAGEIGLLTEKREKSLSECLSASMDEKQYIKLVVKVISWICGVLNPQYVALGGPAFRKECLGPISDGLYSLLPDGMFAEILYTSDVWQDFYEGMALLTAGRMFDEIEPVNE